MSQWTHHAAYPYSRRDRRARVVAVASVKSHAHQRDGVRRPVTVQPTAWPTCSEPWLKEGTLSIGPPPFRRQLHGHRLGPTPEWLVRVSGPVWGKDSRPDVNVGQLARAPGHAPEYREWQALAAAQREKDSSTLTREAEASDPYVGFFVQRPLEKQRTREKLVPDARRRAECEFQESRERRVKAEAETLNRHLYHIDAIKGHAPQSWASSPRAAVSQAERLPAQSARRAQEKLRLRLERQLTISDTASLAAMDAPHQQGWQQVGTRPRSTPPQASRPLHSDVRAALKKG